MSSEPRAAHPFSVPVHGNPAWMPRLPWLIQGTTGKGAPGEATDLRLFGAAPADSVLHRWERLRAEAGARGVVLSRQPHAARIHLHRDAQDGLRIASPADGHATARSGLLLAVAVADCVPVFLVAPEERVVALLHAGWRGTAAGILERGVALFGERFGIGPGRIEVHLGPAICRECYEVGPEVHAVLGRSVAGPALLDLREVLRGRALEVGIEERRLTRSSLCTRCGPEPFYSHRGGDEGRQVAFLGIRGREGVT